MSSPKVKLTINGITAEVESGKTLLECAKDMGVGIAHACFGNALCSTCRVDVVEGADSLSEKQMKETVSLNYHLCFSPDVRLSCQAKVQGPNPVIVESSKPFNWLRPPNDKKKIAALATGNTRDQREG
jgi:ferredoxin, 2Fe-2S